ncbi:MAG: tRNA (N(6)-L-threonylcarbamoyladenosine(37)-C(2))-methylthiotransferase MtaB [Treponema sp.]|jgi:threonylcarbamoyladenosine tRNA methylthiotransferase MtaB|nr:tRNA (N(6)-L-threonylcarbamoyladenosine(37)-C(2))-methylthiotransferase MtaB [Treponema sp.]
MFSVLVHTLGCKLNQLESEALTDAFLQAGFVLHNTLNKTSPSIVVINTCTVTSKADQKARRVIRKQLRDYPDSVIIVTGCYVQLEKQKINALDSGRSGRLFVLKGMEKEYILSLPGFFKTDDKNGKLELLSALKTWQENSAGIAGAFQFSPEKFSGHTRSFLKIQDGCDKHCTYCRIRLARGPSVSLASGIVLERLRILEENHAEAVLTGVNICRYSDAKLSNGAASGLGPSSLEALLEYLLGGTAKICLRLSSLAPDSVNENFAKILSDKRIRPHFHLSVQSGSKKILEKMGRGYSADTVRNAAALLRKAKDDPFLACDIIAGFPGETEDEFTETFELCKEIGFAWIHVFPYSKRPGTEAFSFSEAVPEREISRRVRLFTDLAWKGRAEYINRWLDREVNVLIENNTRTKTACRGVSENYLKLLVQSKDGKPLPGTVLSCRIAENQKIGKNRDFDAVAEEI